MSRPANGKRERAREGSTRRKFAETMMAELRQAGVDGPIACDERRFGLVFDSHIFLNLSNVFAEWKRAPVMQRSEVVRRYATAFFEQDAFACSADAARPNLLMRVGAREWFEIPALRDDAAYAHLPLGEDLGVEIVLDRPHSMVAIGPDVLDAWGMSTKEAVHTATANLRERTPGTLEPLGPGVYGSPWHDSYDPSRLLLHEQVGGLDVRGDLVAVLPDRDHLLITGSDDPAGLATIAEAAERYFDRPRSITARAFVWREGLWQAFLPPEGDPQRGVFCRLAWRTQIRDYGWQKDALEDRHNATGDDVYVASLLVGEDPGTDAGLTACTWSAGTRSLLLPRADDVAFVSSVHAYDTWDVLVVPWNDAARIMGDAMQPQGLRPERFLVERFPNADELAALEQHGTDPAAFHSGAPLAGTPTNRSL